MISCGSVCPPVLVLVCFIMSLSYFALASGQVVETFEALAELNYKPKERILSLARRHRHLKYLGTIFDYCLVLSSFLQCELSGPWQRVLFILAPLKPCMGSALHKRMTRLYSAIMCQKLVYTVLYKSINTICP